MSPGYRMPNQPLKPGEAVPPEATHPATALSVKSLISKSRRWAIPNVTRSQHSGELPGRGSRRRFGWRSPQTGARPGAARAVIR